jgi:1,2-phenylacetyl-CoA epoxidase catalytic subunit
MTTRKEQIPQSFHNAVVKWRETFLPDYEYLIDNWDRFFPNDRKFELCAYRELGMCGEVECGDNKGKPKATKACDLDENQGRHLLGAIRAQASTEFGSIQQHQLTLSRAQDEEEQFWILRMMAEELRHGYQMLHLLLEDDWNKFSDSTSADMVEEILSMRTGSHVLGAFNVDFDSFVDNATFCALIDRVGKYQLQMQKVSSYKPMAESMPEMLREEAFHLLAGTVPLRRWMEKAAKGSTYITSEDIQKAINKWLPRGLEMFGDERGGGTNVRYGLKPMKNKEAQDQYYREVASLVEGINVRFVRARLPEISSSRSQEILDEIVRERKPVEGIAWDDLIHMPHPHFFRRRGVPAFELTGWEGETYEDVDTYARHLMKMLPDSYRAGRDFRFYLETLRKVHDGELTVKDATRAMPELRRVGGTCPCSKSVRWVSDEPLSDQATATETSTPTS